jgi:amino acid transporter
MASKKPQVFVREATGLVKSVSLLDAVSINVSDMSAGAALAVLGFTTILLPTMAGVNLVFASLIAFVLLLPQVVIYTLLTQRMARTGGDYVWVSRSMGGFAGNVLALIGYTMGNIPYLSLIVLSAVFAIGSAGVSLGYSNLLGLALPGNVAGADTTSQFVVAIVILLVLVAINIFRPKLAYKLISAFTIVGVAALVIAIFTLLATGRNGVDTYLSSLGNSTLTYQSVASGYSGPTFDLGATMTFVPFFALFVYPWVNAAPAVASEIKGKNTLKWNVPVSALIAMILMTSAFGAMYYAGGFAFTNAALANPTLVYDYSFNFWTLAMGASGNTLLAWIIGIGWIVWVINIIAYLVVVEGRYLLAQAFDRFLPARVAYVSPSYGSPVNAHIIDFIFAAVLIAGASFLYGTFVSLYGTIVGPMIYFMFVGVSAVIYGIKREKGRTRVILTVAGALSAIVFLWLTAEFLLYPGVWGGNILAYGFLVAVAIGGALIYFASKTYLARRGIDISLAFKELPPE